LRLGDLFTLKVRGLVYTLMLGDLFILRLEDLFTLKVRGPVLHFKVRRPVYTLRLGDLFTLKVRGPV
jgi:hypothetical protein